MPGKDNSRRTSPAVILSLLLLIVLGLTVTRALETRRSKMSPLQPELAIPERLSRRGLTRDLAATIVAMFDKRADALVKGKPESLGVIYSSGESRGMEVPPTEGTPSSGNRGSYGNGETGGGAGGGSGSGSGSDSGSGRDSGSNSRDSNVAGNRDSNGNKALQHEMRRIRYVTAWAAKRGVRFTGSDVYLQIHDMEARGDVILLNVWQSLNLRYTYAETRKARTGASAAVEAAARDKQKDFGAFGIRTRHTLELVRAANGKWLILKDEYTDPLGEDTLVPEVAPATSSAPTQSRNQGRGRSGSYDRRYDRRAAVAYANKYCGVKTGAKAREGKEFGYNPRYKDYTDLGGDCTNFISQVLGDSKGGRLPMDDVWYYDFSAGDGGKGSSAWTETEAFRDYLLGSGIAKCLARGDYYSVTRQTKKFPRGAMNELREGDLIAYEEKGDIQHFAVVVGRDSAGYTLVNSHTADRYRVPWDLGWDRKTIFWLLKIL